MACVHSTSLFVCLKGLLWFLWWGLMWVLTNMYMRDAGTLVQGWWYADMWWFLKFTPAEAVGMLVFPGANTLLAYWYWTILADHSRAETLVEWWYWMILEPRLCTGSLLVCNHWSGLGAYSCRELGCADSRWFLERTPAEPLWSSLLQSLSVGMLVIITLSCSDFVGKQALMFRDAYFRESCLWEVSMLLSW